ncbi:MAG: bacteriohemerythrin [Gemmatimonadota bacterium]
MALIHWSDRFSVHIAGIDEQHQRLVTILNELHEALRAGRGKDSLGSILNGLLAYAGTHFETEERYFAQYEYPDTVEHTREHASFATQVSACKTQFDSGRVSLSVEEMNFLMGWLTQHIEGQDKKCGPFLNEKGVQ